MQNGDLVNLYGGVAASLVLDLVAIFLMTYVLYFRRHWRADLLLSYVALNIGIFVTMSLLTQVRIDIAVGFGLFAILSIIRLRSSAVTQQEVAYYFIALVLGLVNGMGVPDRGLVVALNVVLLLTMFVFDSKVLRDRSRRMDVHLDGIYTDESGAGRRARAQAGRAGGLPGDHRDRSDPRPHARRRAAANPARVLSSRPSPRPTTTRPTASPRDRTRSSTARQRPPRCSAADTTTRSGTVHDRSGRDQLEARGRHAAMG